MPIITKRGDLGVTDLLFNKKTPKTSDRVEALGTIDELNAHFGLARVQTSDQNLISWIEVVQSSLINLMGEIATEDEDLEKYEKKGFGRIQDEDVHALEALANEHEETGNTFKGWIHPGEDGSILRAQLHVCRTVCRRAERRCWSVTREPRLICLYLNRLADVIWLIANP